MATPEDTPRPLDDVLDGLRFAMLTTTSPEGLTARPLTLLEQADGVLRFLVSRRTPWVEDVAAGATAVQVAFADPGSNRWVALSGTADLTDDRAVLDRLWNPAASPFFDGGRDDPDLTALEVAVTSGEWWEGPSGRIGMAVALLRAKLTHDETKAGDHGVVEP